MADEWVTTSIGEQITLQRGFDITKSEQRVGIIPVISSGGISSCHDTAQVRGPGVVIGRKGTLGTVFYLDGDYWPHDTTLWVKDFHGNDVRFVYYFLRSMSGEFMSLDVGSANPTLNRNHVHPLVVEFPSSKDEQRAIARVLGTLDDKIELNRRMNATLEGLARAVFRSWFVDFDPVVAKAAGRRPVGMTAATAALFPDSFEDSSLGPIPKGWELKPIREVTDSLFDGPHATPAEADQGAVFLGIKNLTGTQIDLTEIRYIAEADWAHWTRRVTPRHGDIVFSYEAALGLFALIPSDLRCCLGRRLALIRPSPAHVGPHFLFHTFTGEPFQDLLVSRTVSGSTVDRIPLLDFPTYTILWPNINLRSKFEDFTAQLWRRIHSNQRQVHTLTTLRDALLPRLLSGELRLKDAERAVGEAT